MRQLLRKLATLFRRDTLDRELEEEIQAHLALEAEENERNGMAADEARLAARRQFGNAALLKEESRRAWGWQRIEEFGNDLRYAARSLRKDASFSIAAALTLALGIGANTAVFSVLNALLLRPLALEEPERLVSFTPTTSFSYPDYLDLRNQSASFDGVAAVYPDVTADLSANGPADRLSGEVVSANYFSVAGVRLALGRGFAPEEDRLGGAVVVLSDRVWRRDFAADPAVPGRAVRLNGLSYTVIGVAPASFRGTRRGYAAEYWVPMSMAERIMPWAAEAKLLAERDQRGYMLLGRLKRGITRQQAAADVRVIGERIARSTGFLRNRVVSLETAGALAGRRERQIVNWTAALMAVAVILLLIACANVASLQFARSLRRRREIGIRLAIGAGRGRIIRQLLTESLLLASLGACAGLALALAATGPVSRIELPSQEKFAVDVSPDGRALLFAAVLAVACAIAFGLAPALRATRLDPSRGIRERASNARNILVAAQVALSVALVADAGLLLRSLWNLLAIDPGFRSEGMLVMKIDPSAQGYKQQRTLGVLRSIEERLTALPGIRSTSFASIAPLSNFSSGRGFWTDRQRGGSPTQVNVVVVGAGYFETLGIPLLRGHPFDRARGDPQAVINEAAARLLFPGENPLGRHIVRYDRKRAYEVIAVARDARQATLAEAPGPCMYQLLDQEPGSVVFGMSILVATANDPRPMIAPVRRTIAAVDRDLPLLDLETMQAHIERGLAGSRLSAWLFAAFGALGLLIAAVGIYGLMNYAVRCRTKEIAIRAALGAPSLRLVRTVAARGVALAACGAAAGLGLALATGRLVSNFLYGVTPADAPVLIAAPAALLVVALAASLIPARRATRIDPGEALRYE